MSEQLKDLQALFRDAMEWGRAYLNRAMEVTIEEVSLGLAEKAAALTTAARAAEPARKPLTKDQVDFILRDAFLAANGSVYSTRIYDFVREIEREHGIAASPTPPTSKEGGEKP